MQKLSIRTQQFLGNYNLRQNIVDKFTKISKLGFSMECLAADFLHFYGTALSICLFGVQLGTPLRLPAFQDFLEIS